jgi:predicted transcriptional regulator
MTNRPKQAKVESDEWQVVEIQSGIAELDGSREVSHEKVSTWLKSWGMPEETEAPQ